MWFFIRLVLWGIIWLPFWLIVEIFRFVHHRPRIDNCLSWSARRWQKQGGYLVVRWSRSNKIPFIQWPHFLWLDEQHHDKLKLFVPLDDNMGDHYLPDLWFKGKVRTGDPDDKSEN